MKLWDKFQVVSFSSSVMSLDISIFLEFKACIDLYFLWAVISLSVERCSRIPNYFIRLSEARMLS